MIFLMCSDTGSDVNHAELITFNSKINYVMFGCFYSPDEGSLCLFDLCRCPSFFIERLIFKIGNMPPYTQCPFLCAYVHAPPLDRYLFKEIPRCLALTHLHSLGTSPSFFQELFAARRLACTVVSQHALTLFGLSTSAKISSRKFADIRDSQILSLHPLEAFGCVLPLVRCVIIAHAISVPPRIVWMHCKSPYLAPIPRKKSK